MVADPERNEILSGLLCRLAGNDRGAMQELFDRERSSLFRYFVRLGRCEALAEDLLQNTFMSLWRYRSNFREGIS